MRLLVGPLALILAVTLTGTVAAQPPTANVPASVKARASQHFDAGTEAFARGDYEQAYREFLACYGLIPSLNTLGNLGRLELETGRFVEAARHLREFIARKRQQSQEPGPTALDAYSIALSKVGRLELEVRETDANVFIDDQLVGLSPLPEAWIGEPGDHELRVEKAGHLPGRKRFTLQAGQATREQMALQPAPHDAPADADPAPAAQRDPRPSPLLPPPPGDRDRSGLLQPKTVVLIGGAAITVAAGVAAVYFGLQGDAAHERGQEERRKLLAEGESTLCTRTTSRCRALFEAYDDRAAANRVSNVAIVVAAGSLLATGAAYVFWPDPKPRRIAGVEPWWTVSGAGVNWKGQF